MLAKLHYISQGKDEEEHLKNIEKACFYGIELVQLRLKNLSEKIISTAQKAREITSKYAVKLIINDYPTVARRVNADGVHLGKQDDCPQKVREMLGESYLIGGTANSMEDCQNLIKKKVDYIGLGPFRFTKTKKNLAPVLGLKKSSEIIKSIPMLVPIIAVGGVKESDILDILNIDFFGVAISSEFTKNFEKITKIKAYLNFPHLKNQN